MKTKIDQVGENKKELAGALAAKVMALVSALAGMDADALHITYKDKK